MKLIFNLVLLISLHILRPGTTESTAPRQTEAITVMAWADSLAGKDVRVLFKDSKYRLWVGTRHSGLFLFEPDQMTNFNKDTGLLSNGVTEIIEDSRNSIWVAGGGGVSEFRDERWRNHSLAEMGLSGRAVFSVYEDSQNQIWCAAPGGAARFDDESWRIITEEDGLSHSVVHDIIEGSRGTVWFATRKGGLNELNNNGIFQYHLPDVNCRELLLTGNGDLWVGTGGSGALKYDGERFTAYDAHHTLLPKLEDNAGRIWFATETNLVMQYDGKSWHTVGVCAEAATHDVIAIDQQVVIGTTRGITIVEP